MEYVNAVPQSAWRRSTSPATRSMRVHSGHPRPSVIDPVWELYDAPLSAAAHAHTARVGRSYPSFDEVHAEALKANLYLRKHSGNWRRRAMSTHAASQSMSLAELQRRCCA